MTGEATEFDELEQLLVDLRAAGYEVYLHPNRQVRPAFLQGFAPDAIALRDDKNLVVEVIRKSPESERKVKRIAGLFEGQKDWELRVVWVTPAGSTRNPQVQNKSTIQERLDEVRDLAGSGHPGPALLMAWAILEATGRLLVANQFDRPQTPGRLVQVLASEGYLTPSEADNLRLLAGKRNRLIHGELQTGITNAELDQIVEVLQVLADET